MNLNFNWIVELRNSMTVHSLLSIISLFISLLFFISSFFEKKSSEEFWEKVKSNLSLKVAGVFLVASLAFISHSSVVYALAIFFVATFITNLEFIENIAAIFWKNKEFWDYRKALIGKANQYEKEEKRIKEKETIDAVESELNIQNINKVADVEQEIQGQKSKIKETKYTTSNFESEVFDKLKKSKIFEGFDLNTDIKIQYGKDVKYIFDGLARTSFKDIIIETKYIKNSISQRLTILQVKNYIQELSMLNALQNRLSSVKAIIIVPYTELLPKIQEDIGFLIYDTEKKEFENLDEINDWIKK